IFVLGSTYPFNQRSFLFTTGILLKYLDATLVILRINLIILLEGYYNNLFLKG
ncbi:hypothetical protein C7959_1051, partial [Orenia marismortui]